jgi:hypothetical protein
MKLLSIAFLTALAVVVALSFSQAAPTGASNPPANAIPLLDCADVNGDGGVTAGDIARVVGKFGTVTSDAGYHPLYDVGSPVGAVTAGDLAAVVVDFGDNNGDGSCPLVDTEVAQATLWVLNDNPGLLTQNDALLASLGYYQGSFYVPGQGVHYVNFDNWDGVYDPTAPEGLVYANDKLVAQLYMIDGDVVGWGPIVPPLPDQQDIDDFCIPPIGETVCSWAGNEDGWHWHFDLCTRHIGMPSASALPGQSEQSCNADDDSDCTNPAVPDCNVWDADVGWMGHLFNHFANPNGRFADCFPDGSNWKAFNCPQ